MVPAEKFAKRGVKILVVDDEAIVRQSLKLVLERDGHTVSHVDSGEAALSEMAQHKFDLIITDYSMPGMRGNQLIIHIRQMVPTQPIIMITAFVEKYIAFGETPRKIDALLFKPFSIDEVREAIGQVLSKELGENGLENGLLASTGWAGTMMTK
jgi:CheY-like chemotaxis protein